MAGLMVSMESIAGLRAFHGTDEPDPVAAAVLIELAGADGIAVFVKEDRAHIKDRDLKILRSVLRTKFQLKVAPTTELMGTVLSIKPELVTLVAPSDQKTEKTAVLDLLKGTTSVTQMIDTLQGSGIPVAVRISPDLDQVKMAHQAGAGILEIYTGDFCNETAAKKKEQAFSNIFDTIKLAHKLKLGIHLCGGLSLASLPFFKELPEIEMFIAGRSLMSLAMLKGIPAAVAEFRDRIRMI